MSMKKTQKKRSKPHNLCTDVSTEDLETLANNAKYVGHGAHKRGKNPLVPFQWKTTPRPNASICPPNIRKLDLVNKWLVEGILKGSISAGAQRVWFISEDGIFEAIASSNNEYHGYPIELDELPKGVLELWKK